MVAHNLCIGLLLAHRTFALVKRVNRHRHFSAGLQWIELQDIIAYGKLFNYRPLVHGGNVTFTTDTPGVTVTPVAPGAQQPQPGQGQLPANQNASANNRTGGRVTAVSSNTISVENPEGRASIVTNANTKFTANGQASNLANVTVGKFIEVVGQKQTDGSWLATQVNISTSPPIPLGQQPGQGQPPMGGNPPARK